MVTKKVKKILKLKLVINKDNMLIQIKLYY